MQEDNDTGAGGEAVRRSSRPTTAVEPRELFGQDVASYDAGRPGYPHRVYEVLEERAGLAPGCAVVEVGPGTGQATAELLGHGAEVTAVELSEELAAVLREKLSDRQLSVLVGSFEEVELPPSSFDLVAAATSFHWVPPARGLQRAADVLRPGGSIALWWNYYGDPARPDPFHDALTPVLERLAPELLDPDRSATGGVGRHPHALDSGAREGEIIANGRFGRVYHEVIPWTGRHRPGELRALFGSYSPWLALPIDRRRRVLDALEELAVGQFGGLVERPYLTPVYVASRVR